MPSASAIWVVLLRSITGLAYDIYLGSAYVPPPSSALLHPSSAEDRFSALPEAAAAASALGKVVLMGDFNARVAARPDVDASAHADLLDCQLPVVRGCTDLHFGGHAKQLLHLCLSTDLILGTGRLPGDVPAPLSYPHAAGGSRPDHLALDLEVAAVVRTSKVDASRLESDHLSLCMTLQCSLASQPVPVPDADGTPLPRLNWDDSRREAYVQALDGCALDACAMLAAQGSIPQACEQLSATVLAAAQASGCRFKPAVPAGPPRTQKRRENKPFFDRECRDLKRLYQHTRSRDPEQAHVLLRKYVSVVRQNAASTAASCRQTPCCGRSAADPETSGGNSTANLQPCRGHFSSRANGSSTWRTCVPLPHQCPHHPQHRPLLALSNWHLGLDDAITSGRCKRLCPSSTMADHAPGLAGLQSCCDMLTKRSRWRMARLASCTCWRRS